ncbi:acyl-coenzyme A amino acid N-acyltransferase 1-like isoform X3 [Mytilus californianus]|uniref:acyl-coenzyme A amino acid N-acyltransferase 1-like isoform X3 n=1 Tax=Mytilus californianus TaxID=6549 RepID=UPI00224543C4|nr:acyl-coenzyme A amino acid N-acyltransferase 1-like isoform X3 [Mytilus californianus]
MEIKVYPDEPLVDDKISITISGLSPQQKVTVKSSVTEGKYTFSCSACFISDSSGHVFVDKQPSILGTYTGVDGMGLFWSMTADLGQQKGLRYLKRDVTTPQVVNLSVFEGHHSWNDCHNINQEPLVSTKVERWFLHKTVKREVIRDGILRGTLFTPSGPGPFPGVIDMFGMTGGLIEFRAAILASRGFIVFALPYFQYDDLPKYVKDINFDYLKESIDWFSNHSDVIKNGVGILGVSKGAEIALMLSLECPQVKSVVNINGTPFCSHYPLGPFTDFVESDFSRFEYTDEGVHIWDALNSNFKPDNVLKTWESDVQILYIIGEDDKSVDPDYANVVYNCYPDDQKHKLTIKKYPKAGHLIEPAYLPVCRASFHKVFGIVFVWGGIKEDHARAQEDSWKSILKFFKSTLLNNKTGNNLSSQL